MKFNIEEIIKRADDKIQLALDMNNGDYDLQKDLGWGTHIVYMFYHPDEYCEELVTFDDDEEAQAYLKHMLETHCSDDEDKCWEENMKYFIDNGMTTEESEKDKEKFFAEFDRLSSWDLPMRKGQNRANGITVGYAEASDFVECLPEDKAKYFLQSFFWSFLIPGYYEEH